MFFAVGTKVKLINTGDKGVITESLGGDMFIVYLEDPDMEIPASAENLERLDDRRKKPTAQFVKGKQPKPIPELTSPAVQYKILSHKGILIAFVPDYNLDGTTSHFDIKLINDTAHTILFSYHLQLEGITKKQHKSLLASAAVFELGRLSYAELNETPAFQLDCWEQKTNGTGSKLSKRIKVKPKHFFSRLATAPLVNEQAHLYIVFDKLAAPPKVKKKKGEDLTTYTLKSAPPIKKVSYYKKYADIEEFAAFKTEIDLHIEQLIGDASDKSNSEILRIQLDHFDRYISRAVQLGIKRVFVIHGLGKGVLKDAIASRLLQNPDVRTFKNEYHPRYGFGATEVLL